MRRRPPFACELELTAGLATAAQRRTRRRWRWRSGRGLPDGAVDGDEGPCAEMQALRLSGVSAPRARRCQRRVREEQNYRYHRAGARVSLETSRRSICFNLCRAHVSHVSIYSEPWTTSLTMQNLDVRIKFVLCPSSRSCAADSVRAAPSGASIGAGPLLAADQMRPRRTQQPPPPANMVSRPRADGSPRVLWCRLCSTRPDPWRCQQLAPGHAR